MNIKIQKISVIRLTQNDCVKTNLLNPVNVPMLLSTILVVDAKIGKWNKAGQI